MLALSARRGLAAFATTALVTATAVLAGGAPASAEVGDPINAVCAGSTQADVDLLNTLAQLGGSPPAPGTDSTLPVIINVDPVVPGSVDPGQTFTPTFTPRVTLPPELLASLQGFGIVGPVQINDVVTTLATTNANPASVASPPFSTILNVPAPPAAIDPTVVAASFGSPLTATGPDQSAIDYTFDSMVINVYVASGVPLLGSLSLGITCTPEAGADVIASTDILQPGPPIAPDASTQVPLGGSKTITLGVTGNPAVDSVVIDTNGTLGTGSIAKVGNLWRLTYVHDANEGPGSDSITYTATNALGSATGTVTISVLGNQCEANPSCSLDQIIEFDVEGTTLSMEQDAAEVTLDTVTLDGTPQSTTGELNNVTVIDARGDGAGWDLVGSVTDFKVDAAVPDCPRGDSSTWSYRCIPANNLGWSPAATVAHQVIPGDVAAVNAGTMSDASAIMAGTAGSGLEVDQALCTADPTTNGGTFVCGAGLALLVPASASAGTYSATLTLTLS